VWSDVHVTIVLFDGLLSIQVNPSDKELDLYSTEGPTRKYLQRKVSQQDFPWVDLGTYFKPRLWLRVSNEPARRVEEHELLSLALIDPS
jgi:hypothetical protein